MALHLVKLCVGVDSVEDLARWAEARRRKAEAAGLAFAPSHVTRMQPRRVEELLDGGSLYWVVKGAVQVRQRLTGIEPFVDAEGIGRCRLVLDHALVATEMRMMRPFQGWRYLKPEDAPADLGEAGDGLPAELRRELAGLGLL